jgi:hypothetical protein
MDIQKLQNKRLEVYFDELFLLKSYARIRLFDFTHAEEKIIKNTEYYVFDADFVKENELNIKPYRQIFLWITKEAFDREIIRHIDFKNINQTERKDLTLEIKRTSKRTIVIKNLKEDR